MSAELSLADARQLAARWADKLGPVIVARLRLIEISDALSSAERTDDVDATMEGFADLARDLDDMLDDTRERTILDLLPNSCPPIDDDAAWDAFEEREREIRAAAPSVTEAINHVRRTMQ